MGRPIRDFRQGYSYHVTVRCNNRDFHLHRRPCREVILYCVKRALEKFDFTLYAICVMSSHVHYLIEPARPDDLPRIMHFVNWYSAMCLNRLLGRRGHFWEKRYHAAGFRNADRRRALNVLRYIHGNPMAAGLSGGFVYPFSNYGTYENLRDDGLTRWHGSCGWVFLWRNARSGTAPSANATRQSPRRRLRLLLGGVVCLPP